MAVDAEITLGKKRSCRGRPWVKGQSGNPAGRPKGSLNKSTISARKLAQKFLNEAVEPVFQKLVEMAQQGDPQALRLVVERILPAMKAFEEPKIRQHALEVVLKEPEWMKLKAPEPVTIEHEPDADTEASDASFACAHARPSRGLRGG
jgi:hypothetical protein